MDNPYEQQQTALVSRIINNVVPLVSLTLSLIYKEKLNEAIVELSRSLQVILTKKKRDD
jgi:hypothetical protein